MTVRTRRIAGVLFATLCVLDLTGCETAVEPTYYVLDPPAAAAEGGSAQTSTIVGLRELALPLYARRTQIAVAGIGGAITLSDDHRWAEESPRAMTRVVARALSAATGSAVVIEPWPLDTRPILRVDIEVDYFAGQLDGDLRLEGQYRVVPATGAPLNRTFSLTERSSGDGFQDLVDRHLRALEALARKIASDL